MHPPVSFVVDKARKLIDKMTRQAVRQAKCDGLYDGTTIEVRQISAFVPALLPAGRQRSQQDAHPARLLHRRVRTLPKVSELLFSHSREIVCKGKQR